MARGIELPIGEPNVPDPVFEVFGLAASDVLAASVAARELASPELPSSALFALVLFVVALFLFESELPVEVPRFGSLVREERDLEESPAVVGENEGCCSSNFWTGAALEPANTSSSLSRGIE